jgi:hypothetical protein
MLFAPRPMRESLELRGSHARTPASSLQAAGSPTSQMTPLSSGD